MAKFSKNATGTNFTSSLFQSEQEVVCELHIPKPFSSIVYMCTFSTIMLKSTDWFLFFYYQSNKIQHWGKEKQELNDVSETVWVSLFMFLSHPVDGLVTLTDSQVSQLGGMRCFVCCSLWFSLRKWWIALHSNLLYSTLRGLGQQVREESLGHIKKAFSNLLSCSHLHETQCK